MPLLSHQSIVVMSEPHLRNCQLHAGWTLSLVTDPVNVNTILVIFFPVSPLFSFICIIFILNTGNLNNLPYLF